MPVLNSVVVQVAAVVQGRGVRELVLSFGDAFVQGVVASLLGARGWRYSLCFLLSYWVERLLELRRYSDLAAVVPLLLEGLLGSLIWMECLLLGLSEVLQEWGHVCVLCSVGSRDLQSGPLLERSLLGMRWNPQWHYGSLWAVLPPHWP